MGKQDRFSKKTVTTEEYQERRDLVLNSEYYKNSNKDDKEELLNNFFEMETVHFLSSKGIESDKEISEMRDKFLSKYGGTVKKKDLSPDGGQQSQQLSQEEPKSELPTEQTQSKFSESNQPLKPQELKLEDVANQVQAETDFELHNKGEQKFTPIELDTPIEQDPDRSVPGRLNKTDIDIANKSLKQLKKTYVDPEGARMDIDKPEYYEQIKKTLPKDITPAQATMIESKIDDEIKAARKSSQDKVDVIASDKKLKEELGEMTYRRLMEQVDNPDFTSEGKTEFWGNYTISPSSEYMKYTGGERTFGDNYVREQIRKGNYVTQNIGYETDKDVLLDQYKQGNVAIKNPLFKEEYKSLVESKIKDNTEKGGYNLEKADLSQYSKEEVNNQIGSELSSTLSPSEKTVSDYNNAVYNAVGNGASQEQVDALIALAEKAKVVSTDKTLYDPLTGQRVAEEVATPDQLDWNKKANEYALKFSEDSNLKEDLESIRTRLYYESKYLEDKLISSVDKQISPEATDEEREQVAKTVISEQMYSDNPVARQYRDIQQQLYGVNYALTQNIDPAKIDRSLATTFAEGMGEAVTGKDIQTQQDIPSEYVSGVKGKGGKVTPEQEERITRTLGEDIASGMGSTIPELFKFMGVAIATEGLGVDAAMTSWANRLKAATNSKTITSATDAILPLVKSEMQFQLAGQDAGTGLGEEFGGQAWDSFEVEKLLSKMGGNKIFKAIAGTSGRTFSKGIAETIQEYTGEFVDRLSDETTSEAFKNTIGDDPFRKLVTTYTIAQTLGLGSINQDYKDAIKQMEVVIANYDTEGNKENEETKEEILNNITPEEAKVEVEPQKEVKDELPEEAPKEVEVSEETTEVEPKGEETTSEDIEQPTREVEEVIEPTQEAVEEVKTETKVETPKKEIKVSKERTYSLPNTEVPYKVSNKKTKSGNLILVPAEGKGPKKTIPESKLQEQLNDGTISETQPKEGNIVFESKDDSRYSLVETKTGLKVFNHSKGKVVEKSKNKKHLIQEYKDSKVVEFQNGKEVEPDRGDTENDYNLKVASKSENPRQIAEAWENSSKNETSKVDFDLDGVIAEHMGKMTSESFSNEIDPNSITPSMRLNYFSTKKNGGKSMDVLARQIIEEGYNQDPDNFNMTEQEMIQAMGDFMVRYSKTSSYVKPQTTTDFLAERFHEITGLDIDQEYANKLTSYSDGKGLAPREIEPEEKKVLEDKIKDKPKADKVKRESIIKEETERKQHKEAIKEEQAKIDAEVEDVQKKTIKSDDKPISIKEARELHRLGVRGDNIDNDIENQKKKVKDAINKSRGNLNMGMPIDYNTLKETTKLIKLWTIKHGRNFGKFLKENAIKPVKWVKDLFNAIVVKTSNKILGTEIITNFEKRKLATVLPTINSMEIAQEYIKELTEAKTKEELTELLAEMITLNDVQQSQTKNEGLLDDLKAARQSIVELYNDIRTKDFETAMNIINGVEVELEKDSDKSWVNSAETLSQYVERRLTDKTNPIRIIQDLIAKQTGDKLTPEQDVHGLIDLETGKVVTQVEKLMIWLNGGERTGVFGKDRRKDSFLGRLKKDGLDFDSIGQYMMYKHIPERNIRLKAVREAAYKQSLSDLNKQLDEGEIDFVAHQEAISELELNHKENMKFANTGMESEQAEILAKNMEDKYGKDVLEKHSKDFREKVLETKVDILLEGGVIDQATADKMINGEGEGINFEHYVPMKVQKSVIDDILEAYGSFNQMSQGQQVLHGLSPDAKSGKFKHFDRVNPIYQSIYEMTSALRVAESNKTKNALADLVREYPNNDVWSIMESSVAKTNAINNGAEHKHFVEYKTENKDGKLVTKYVHLKTPRLQNMFGSDKKNASAEQSKAVKSMRSLTNKAIDGFNNWSRNLYTVFNISFGLPNIFRDVQDVLFNVSKNDQKKLRRKILKNLPKALAGATQAMHGYSDSKWAKAYQDMLEQGGVVSWLDLKDVDKVTETLNKQMKEAGTWKEAHKYATNALLMFNSVLEQTTRLSVYQSSVDAGMTKHDAAKLSKNASINFSKKGELSSFLNRYWLFSGAGMQGANTTIRRIGSKGGRKAALTVMTISVLQAMLRDYLMDDEDEALLTEHDYDNYWIFPMGKGNEPIKIPKPYSGVKALSNLADGLYRSKETGRPFEAVKGFGSDAVSLFDVIGGGSSNLVSKISPEIAKPAAELIFGNKDYKGAEIVPEKQWSKTEHREVEKFEKDTPEIYKEVANYMTEAGLDWSPEAYKHLFEGYVYKGALQDAGRVYDIIDKVEKGEKVKTKDIPIIRRFFMNLGDEKGWRSYVKMQELKEKSDWSLLTEKEMKAMRVMTTTSEFNNEGIWKGFFFNQKRVYEEKGKEDEFNKIMDKILQRK